MTAAEHVGAGHHRLPSHQGPSRRRSAADASWLRHAVQAVPPVGSQSHLSVLCRPFSKNRSDLCADVFGSF